MSPDSTTSSFAGLVSRDSIRISLTYAALLGLPVIRANICNAYLQAPSPEKHFISCGPEFGIENEGRVDLIWRISTMVKLQAVIFGTTSKIAWDNWDFLLHVLSGCMA